MLKQLTKEASGGQVTSQEDMRRAVWNWARGKQKGRGRAVRRAGVASASSQPAGSRKRTARCLAALLPLRPRVCDASPRALHTAATTEPRTRNEAQQICWDVRTPSPTSESQHRAWDSSLGLTTCPQVRLPH